MRTFRSPYRFASLPPFTWEGLQPLTIVTGANGIGKSHLLWLLSGALGGPTHRSGQLLGTAEIDGVMVMDPTCTRPRLVGFLPAVWSTGPAQASANVMYGDIDRIVKAARRAAFLKRHGGQLEPISTIAGTFEQLIWMSADDGAELDALGERVTHADVLAKRGQYGFVQANASDPIGTLAQIFFAHASARVNHLLRGTPPGSIDALVGSPPWHRAAELLATFDVAFTIDPPIDIRFEYTLTCRLRDQVVVSPNELSSGEQTILALVATIVVGETLAARTGDARGLLLLDEPDAHVHTSIIKNYVGHLQTLVDDGFQIILVTHRPETMLLCPPDSLVEMRRDGAQLEFVPVPPPRRPALIARLAGDTVAVLPSVRVVLVEDEADRRFHQWAYERAVALSLIPANPRLVFMPVVAAKGGGGKAAVRRRIEALAAEGLLSIHRGLIDRDGEDDELPDGVLRHTRYAIENYFVDPIALYCAMVNASDLDEKIGWSKAVGVRRGDLSDLRRAPADRLQAIVEHVVAAFASHTSLANLDPREIILHGDADPVTLTYPRWVFDTSKADLRSAVGKLHLNAGPGVLSTAHFNGGPELSGLVPADLVDIYRRLITERL